MGIEIERKFLVVGDGWRGEGGIRLRQGYLNRDPERTVRVRIAGGRAFLAIKGLTRGAVRSEFEYEIPPREAEALLNLCEGAVLEKTRHVVPFGGFRWEIDEFHGRHAGLVLAEIELSHPDEAFPRPPWLGREVTGDPRYFNSTLQGTSILISLYSS